MELEIDTKEKADAYFDIKTDERISELETKINKLNPNRSLNLIIMFSLIALSGFLEVMQQPISFMWTFVIVAGCASAQELASLKRTKYFLELIELKTKKV